MDETSLPEYVGGARCVVLGADGVVYVGTTRFLASEYAVVFGQVLNDN